MKRYYKCNHELRSKSMLLIYITITCILKLKAQPSLQRWHDLSSLDFQRKWYIRHPIHGMLIPLTMVYRIPYPWYFDPLPMVFWPPTLFLYPSYVDSLPMVYRTPYPWYSDPHIHDILIPLPSYFEPPT